MCDHPSCKSYAFFKHVWHDPAGLKALRKALHNGVGNAHCSQTSRGRRPLASVDHAATPGRCGGLQDSIEISNSTPTSFVRLPQEARFTWLCLFADGEIIGKTGEVCNFCRRRHATAEATKTKTSQRVHWLADFCTRPRYPALDHAHRFPRRAEGQQQTAKTMFPLPHRTCVASSSHPFPRKTRSCIRCCSRSQSFVF